MSQDEELMDRASRIVYLFSVGVPSEVIACAIGRSCDAETLGAALGLIEDIIDLGCAISDPS